MPYCAERTIRRIPVDRIEVGARHPRHDADLRIDSLAASIRRYGLLSPILVRRVDAGRYELIAGARRLCAVRALRQTSVDAIVLPVFDGDCADISLHENLRRQPLHYLDEIAADGRASDERRRLLTLPPDVKDFLRTHRLSEGHALALTNVEGEARQLRLAREAAERHLSARQFEARVRSDRPRPTVSGVVRDHRIVINALTDTVQELRRIGIQATSRVEEKDGCIDVIVTIRPSKP